MAFCSPNSLKGYSTSRRDDLFSILYLIIYTWSGKIPFLNMKMSKDEQLNDYKTKKKTSNAKTLCEEHGCKFMYDFAKEIYALRFKEKPDYSKLRFLLTKEILNMDIQPSK